MIPIVLAVLVLIMLFVTILPDEIDRLGFIFGPFVFFLYYFGIRKLLTGQLQKGLKAFDKDNWDESIVFFESTYDFFNRHPWIDKYRSIVLMESSAIEYREMALMNIAVAYGQMGNQDKVRQYCEWTLREFPESIVAKNTLRLIGDN